MNALTLNATGGLSGTQSGSAYTIDGSATKALVVNITGTTGSYVADKTNAEIWAAYQAGRAVYAVWEGMVLYPFSVEADAFWFVATAGSDQLSVVVQTTSSGQQVYVEQGKIADGRPELRTATLTTSGWSNNAQTVTVQGVSADTSAQLIYVSPASKAAATAWGEAGVFCAGQDANSLTFVCDSVPSSNITVNISIQEAQT